MVLGLKAVGRLPTAKSVIITSNEPWPSWRALRWSVMLCSATCDVRVRVRVPGSGLGLGLGLGLEFRVRVRVRGSGRGRPATR